MAEWTIDDATFHIKRGNLAEQSVDAIALDVGVDWHPAGPATGAIFGQAGHKLGDDVATFSSATSGEVEQLDGYNLPADSIYLVAMEPDRANSDNVLTRCYENLFDRVNSDDIHRLALPPLGLGDFDVSIDRTSRIGIELIHSRLKTGDGPDEVSLVVYDAIEFSSVENFGEAIIEGEEVDPDPEQQLRDYY